MVDSVTISAGKHGSATLGRQARRTVAKAIEKALEGQNQQHEEEARSGPGPAQSEEARRDPEALAYVPMVLGEFREAPELQELATHIIRKHHLTFLENLTIVYHWKAKGGLKGGKVTYGKCVKLSGLAQHYAQAPFQIWLAADAVSADEFTNFQLEALLHHELRHITTEEDDEGNVTYALRGHDLEVFFEDLELYGDWQRDIKAARRVFEQLELVNFVGFAE